MSFYKVQRNNINKIRYKSRNVRNSTINESEYDCTTFTEIESNQITDFKVNYHKQILQKWLSENPQIKLSFNELWTIREQCIEDLAKWTENTSH